LAAKPDNWRIAFQALRTDFGTAADANPLLRHLVAEGPRFVADPDRPGHGRVTPDLPGAWQQIVFEGHVPRRHPLDTGRNVVHVSEWYKLDDRKAIAHLYGPGDDLKKFERLAASAWTALPEGIANAALEPCPDPKGWPRLYIDPPDKKAPPSARGERWTWFVYWLLSQNQGSYVSAMDYGATTIRRLNDDPFTASRVAIDILLTQAENGAEPTARLNFDRESLTITLDGISYPGIDPTAFQLFEEIHRGDGRPVSGRTLLQLPGCRGKKIPRELDKLPEPLRRLVMARPGSGRWIELPPI
jgi:hypothetical protein